MVLSIILSGVAAVHVRNEQVTAVGADGAVAVEATTSMGTWYGDVPCLELAYGWAAGQVEASGTSVAIKIDVEDLEAYTNSFASIMRVITVPYSLRKLGECLSGVSDGAELHRQMDLYGALTSHKSYLPSYVEKGSWTYKSQFEPRTTRAEFTERGLTPDAKSAQILFQINRMPFVEDWVRLKQDPWTLTTNHAALQSMHAVLEMLPEAVRDADFAPWAPTSAMDAGCGTGYIALALAAAGAMARHSSAYAGLPQFSKVTCLEYVDWVATRAGKIMTQPNLVAEDAAVPPGWAPSQSVTVVEGDALSMTYKSGGGTAALPEHDLIIFGVSVDFGGSELDRPSDAMLDSWDRTVAMNGIVYAPFCDVNPYKGGGGNMYCHGHWRAFQRLDGALFATQEVTALGEKIMAKRAAMIPSKKSMFVEIPLPAKMPCKFISPFCATDSSFLQVDGQPAKPCLACHAQGTEPGYEELE